MNEDLEAELYEQDPPKFPNFCEWWALCDNQATTTRHHPILGEVPICQRCNEKVESLS